MSSNEHNGQTDPHDGNDSFPGGTVLVHAAIEGISPDLRPIMRAHYKLSQERRRTVLGDELADALQMPRERVDGQLKHARETTAAAIVSLILARTGREHCTQLAQQLDTILSPEQQQAGHDLVLNPKQTKAITQHTTTCQICGPQARQAHKRWALPALLPLTEDDEERRRGAAALFSRDTSPTSSASSTTAPTAASTTASSAASAASTAGSAADKTTTVAGLVERLRLAVTTGMARMPGTSHLMNIAHHDPDAFRRIVGGVAASIGVIVIAVGAVVAVDTIHDPPTAGATTAAAATDPADRNPGPGDTNPGPGTEPPGESGEPGNTGPGNTGPSTPGSSTPGPSTPGPSTLGPGNTGSSTPGESDRHSSTTFPITFDASRLSYDHVLVSGIGRVKSVQRTLHLLPGDHVVASGAEKKNMLRFQVTDTGRITYNQKLDPVINGRNSSTLTLRGATITFDASKLSYDHVLVSGIGRVSTNQPRTLRLLPGAHVIQLPDGRLDFRVTDTGQVTYDPSLDPALSGQGSSTLTIR